MDVSQVFIGASAFPSTNNGLERCNLEVKKSHTFRERLKFNAFTEVVEKMLKVDWSMGQKEPEEAQIHIEHKLYAKAFELQKENRQILGSKGSENYILRTSEQPELTDLQVKIAASKICLDDFTSFELYKEWRFQVFMFKFELCNCLSCRYTSLLSTTTSLTVAARRVQRKRVASTLSIFCVKCANSNTRMT